MEYTIRLKLGKKIKELRQKCGYTQEKLSEVANIDYKYIQRIEGKKPACCEDWYYWKALQGAEGETFQIAGFLSGIAAITGVINAAPTTLKFLFNYI